MRTEARQHKPRRPGEPPQTGHLQGAQIFSSGPGDRVSWACLGGLSTLGATEFGSIYQFFTFTTPPTPSDGETAARPSRAE